MNLEEKYREYSINKRRKKLYYLFLSFVSILTFLCIWQITVTAELVNVKNLPSPVEVFQAFLFKLHSKSPDGNTLGTNVLASFQVSLSGFFAALVVGIPLGLFMGWFEPIDRFVRPVFELVRPVPPIAWIPVVVIFMGIGLKAKGTIIFLSVFVSCVINSYTGIRMTDRTLINVAKTFGAGDFETFIKIGIPSAMPMIFAGIRVSLSTSWSTLVAAEMVAATAGLGYMLQTGRNLGNAGIVVLSMIVIAILGAAMGVVLDILESVALKWKVDR